MTECKVELYIYDLSQGIASIMSTACIGKKIDGLWHTAIVVYSREYFFGSRGIENCNPGTTLLGAPLKKLELGTTQIPYSLFKEYLNALTQESFAPHTYDLLKHNCNNFSDEIGHFLCGVNIPKYILDLPNEILQTRLGSTLHGLIQRLERSIRPFGQEDDVEDVQLQQKENSPDLEHLNTEIEEARYNSFLLEQRRRTLKEKLARKEHRRQKKRNKLLKEGRAIPPELEDITMADTEAVNGNQQLPTDEAIALDEEAEKREEEEKKKNREPPIIYKDLLDIKVEFDALVGLIDGKLNDDEQQSLEELHQFMIKDEGSWVLGENFLAFIGRLLNDKDLSLEVRVRTLNVLSLAALKDDVILLLHQDRREHVLMNYAFEIDRLEVEEQEALALFIVNMFENLSSSEWLLYISEWPYNNQQISNIRVTTKVAVHSLLSDRPALQERGVAIVHNLACKEVKTVVFDDVAVELTMAVLQYFNSKPSEELLYGCMKALSKFVQISRQEVPQLIQMIGPDPKTFKGTSQRIDELIDTISTKIR